MTGNRFLTNFSPEFIHIHSLKYLSMYKNQRWCLINGNFSLCKIPIKRVPLSRNKKKKLVFFIIGEKAGEVVTDT